MVIIILLLIVIIAIPICIRMSHHSRLNNRSVTETAHLIAKDVYSEAQEYAAAHGLDLDRDIVSFYVGTQGIYFCAIAKRIIVGINAKTVPAAISPHLMSKLRIREFRPTGMVLLSLEFKNMTAK